ncbi:hypothetical protein DFH29DRAFT_564843 [Suillus ampliporus]|nr:hypothetical protein DFH29DRAFT_564843 [Suillus ampliporus]
MYPAMHAAHANDPPVMVSSSRSSSLIGGNGCTRVSPFTYIIKGLLGQAVGGEAIRCASTELVSVNPPKGLTCGKYMGPFTESAGGYLTNPEAAEGCQYCPYTTVDQYMYSRFNIKFSDHWRNLGIVFGFVAFNIIAIFWLTYFMRIRTVSVFASLKQKFRGKSIHTA